VGDQKFRGLPQRCDRMFAGYRREVIQEYFQGITSRQIVEEPATKNRCANKDWRAAEHIEVAVDDRRDCWHRDISCA
jgi:hypothetical protein